MTRKFPFILGQCCFAQCKHWGPPRCEQCRVISRTHRTRSFLRYIKSTALSFVQSSHTFGGCTMCVDPAHCMRHCFPYRSGGPVQLAYARYEATATVQVPYHGTQQYRYAELLFVPLHVSKPVPLPPHCSSMQHPFPGLKVRTACSICTPHRECTGDSCVLPHENNCGPRMKVESLERHGPTPTL